MNIEHQVQERLTRAREILRTARHAAMATVNADGTPHNTPFYLILEPDLTRVYFGSHPESLHSQNVARTGELFVVIYDMIERGGLYLRATSGRELAGAAVEQGLAAHNATRARENKPPLPIEYYQGKSPQRLYGAAITTFWIYLSERDADGHVAREYRHEINRDQLL